MEHIETWLRVVGAVIAAVFTYLFGGMDAILTILLCLMVIDYISGILAAVYTKTLNSEIGFRGIIKKTSILCIIAVAHLAGQATGIDTIRSLVIGFYIANEGISVIENLGRTGIPFPDKLKKILEQLKRQGDNDDE